MSAESASGQVKVPWMSLAILFLLGLFLFGLLFPPAPAKPTDRELQEEAARIFLEKHGGPGHSQAETDRNAKAVIDAWERSSK